MINLQTYIASNRFGLGSSPDELTRIQNAPKRWLEEQLNAPQIRGDLFATLSSSAQNMQAVYEVKRALDNGATKEEAKKQKQEILKETFIKELSAKLQLAITTPTPFYERLVDFWSNHFAVSVKKGAVRGLAGSFEREAIRPHVMGKFNTMLLAVEQHPAMLVYLDNAQSIGPDSKAGERRGKGLNENLAREIMELHTLGVDGGYTQTDVTSFAKVITGWSISGPKSSNPGVFEFAANRHEPGAQQIMGKTYSADDQAQGEHVLRDLAAHHATAHHIATKLARHFIADEPPEQAVATLAKVFLSTGGDLPALYNAIIELPEAWDVIRNVKIKNGYDLIVSAARASNRSDEEDVKYCLGALKFLADVPFTADSPAGMPDVANEIAGPAAMIRRVEWAQSGARKLAPSMKAETLAEYVIGPIMSDATSAAIASAKHEPEAVAILFGSPEFQRR